MKKLLLLLCLALFVTGGLAATDTGRGRMTGGIAHSHPDWFKPSFLNFQDEIQELRKNGRHLLVFMDLNDCPYCARTLEENFQGGANRPFIQAHFDVIAVNARGDNEVTWIDGATYTEQQLAAKLKVVGTPTLVFIDPDGNKVLQLNGYRTPTTLRHALEYVQTRAYRHGALADYIEKKQHAAVYTFRPHPRFENITDFARLRKPLAVIFENRDCADCRGFHDKVLHHPEVLEEMKAFHVVRLDAYADTPIVDVAGTRTTPRRWAAALDLGYRPGVVLFDQGKEIARMEGRLYPFHFKEMLRFVSGGHYQRHDHFSNYLKARQQELLEQGVNIHVGE